MSILICGLSNAGKTTYSRKFDNVIHYDEVGGTTRQRHEAIVNMAKKQEVCVEGVYSEAFRRAELAQAIKGRKVCIWLNTPLDVCMSRPDFKGTRKFEPPTLAEGWNEIIIIGGNDVKSISNEVKT